MSLADLLEARRAGKKPDHVLVLIGTKPKALDDGLDRVHIAPTDRPQLMDLRALVGCTVTVVETERNDPLFEQAVEALQAAGARIEGLVSSAGATGRDAEHETILTRMREHLCP
jgi:hypothetical protein